MSDNVNHPAHYADKQIEVIDYIKDTLPHECYVGYLWGNALKYLSRWKKKGGAEDLEKGAVYLKWLIEATTEEQRQADAKMEELIEVVPTWQG